MRYKFELSIVTVLFCLSLAPVASADNVVKTLYVDGNEVGSSAADKALSFPYPRLTIGSEGNRWYRYNGLVGLIDEFAVYTGVLTEAQIDTHYDAGPGGYVAAVLANNPLLYLQFEDATSAHGDLAGLADPHDRACDPYL